MLLYFKESLKRSAVLYSIDEFAEEADAVACVYTKIFLIGYLLSACLPAYYPADSSWSVIYSG